jgi:hypothetical protein
LVTQHYAALGLKSRRKLNIKTPLFRHNDTVILT